MRAERLAWAAVVTILFTALGWNYLEDKSLRSAVLASDFEQEYVSATLSDFGKRQGVDRRTILHDFYLMHIGLSDRSCIGLVPKQGLAGGATTYCYARTSPARLISVDSEGE